MEKEKYLISLNQNLAKLRGAKTKRNDLFLIFGFGLSSIERRGIIMLSKS